MLINRIDIREEYRIAVKTALINQWNHNKITECNLFDHGS